MKKFNLIFIFYLLLNNIASASDWDSVNVILSRLKEPIFPDTSFYITDYGAIGDSSTLCTEAFQRAIDSCTKAGGGKVIVDKGIFITGPIHLKSNVNLYISPNAKIVFTSDHEQYKPYVYTRFEGVEFMGYSPLIYAYEQENIAITGGGTLDGLGGDWNSWTAQSYSDKQILLQWAEDGIPVSERIFENGSKLRPPMIQPYKCKNVFIDSINVREGPFWHLHPVLCTNVKITNVSVIGHWHNNDGCNPESCKDVLIRNCYFDTGDDCIAIKSGRNTDGRRVNVPTENVVVQNCTMKDGHGGIVIGSESTGGARYIFAEDCFMDSPNLWYILRIKTNSYRGSHVHHIFVRNIEALTVDNSMLRVNYNYGEGDGGNFQPDVHDIYLENIQVKNSVNVPLQISCYNNNPVRDVYIKNCHLKAQSTYNTLDYIQHMYIDSSSVNDYPLLYRKHSKNKIEAEYYMQAKNISFSNYEFKKSGYGYIEAAGENFNVQWETDSTRFVGDTLLIFYNNANEGNLSMNLNIDGELHQVSFSQSESTNWDTLRLAFSNTRKISNLSIESNNAISGFLLDRIEITKPVISSVHNILENNTFVYPNPASDEIQIKGLPTNLSYIISITSVDGKKLKQIKSDPVVNQPIVIKTDDIQTGIYTLSIENKSGVISKLICILND